jgi:glutathione S-transferase
MKLIFSPASPFVRKVNVMRYEAELVDKISLTPVQTTALSTDPAARSANPLGKIPALILDNGKTLFDSRVICRYLDDLSGAGLYPQPNLWDVLTLEALADGIMESAVLMVYEARLRPEKNRFETWVEAQWSKITHSLDALEHREFTAMEGDLHFGQLALACALGYLDFRHPERNWREGRTSLDSWNNVMQDRDSMRSTLPEG